MKPLMVALLLGGFCAAGVVAAPHVPKDEATILERLPLRRSDPVAAELRKLRGAALARRYFELAMAQGDPRYVGYAEAALRDAHDDPPAEVLFVRGLLKQYRQDSSGAWRDPEAGPKRATYLPGARACRGATSTVGADDASARGGCRGFGPRASELSATGWRSAVDGATGKGRPGYGGLKGA